MHAAIDMLQHLPATKNEKLDSWIQMESGFLICIIAPKPPCVLQIIGFAGFTVLLVFCSSEFTRAVRKFLHQQMTGQTTSAYSVVYAVVCGKVSEV